MTVKKHWFSCRALTVQVNVNAKNQIVWTAAICQRFLGQDLKQLEKWMTRLGGFRKATIDYREVDDDEIYTIP